MQDLVKGGQGRSSSGVEVAAELCAIACAGVLALLMIALIFWRP